MWGWRSSRTVVIGLAAALFVASSVLPVASFLMTSVRRRDGRIRTRRSAMGASGQHRGPRPRLRRSGDRDGRAAGSAARAGVASLQGDAAGRACRTPAPAPLCGGARVDVSWRAAAGSLAAVAGYGALAAWTYSLPAAVLVLGLVLYPLSMLATEVALRRIDGRLEEAALMVAGPGACVLAHHGAPRGSRASWPPRW